MSFAYTYVSPILQETAKARRRHRDATTVNRFPTKGTDRRWQGELGEICFDKWLAHHALEREWNGGADELPDFEVAGHTIAVKTRCDENLPDPPLRSHHWVFVPTEHLAREIDLFVFACLLVKESKLLILGAIDRSEFIARARPARGPGFISPCRFLPIAELYPPELLLRCLTHERPNPAAAGSDFKQAAPAPTRKALVA